MWEEVEKIKDTETYKYIRALIKQSDIPSAKEHDFEQSIIDLVGAYATIYENVWLITNREYEEFNHQSVFTFTPEELCDLISADKEFQEHLCGLEQKIEEKKGREAE